ncbi:MAG: cupin domain-containing protein [Pseudomonadota bacterium]
MIFSDGGETQELPAIQAKLGEIGITLRQWPLPDDAAMRRLLEQPALDDAQKEQLLRAVDHRFETLKQEAGYTTRDMVVLHENIPGLADMLGKFDKVHYHTDDEVRYILAGKGYFGFVDPRGEQFMLEVAASDYINVPANTEHWFTLGGSKRIKAVRYFIDTSGWTPVYTQRAVASFE